MPDRRSSRRAWLAIAATALTVLVLAALSAPMSPLFDPDEGYYPATAAETLRSGTFWDPQFNGVPRWDKPILSYALIEGAFQLLGQRASSARIPSAIEAAALILMLGGAVKRLAGARAAMLCVLVAGSTVGIAMFSRIAHPEMGVVLSIVTTELLACVWLTTAGRAARRLLAIAMGASIAYGLLAKGPVALALPLLALLGTGAIARVQIGRWLDVIADAALALVVAAGLAVPWYWAMFARHGSMFLADAVWRQNVGRYTTAAYGHHGGPLLLTVGLLVGLFPWTAVLPQALARLRLRAGGTRELLRLCMFASAVTALLFYSLSSSKLASYALVCVPPLSIIIGLAIDECLADAPRADGLMRNIAVLMFAIGVALLGAPAVAGKFVTARELLGSVRPDIVDVGDLIAPVARPLGIFVVTSALVVIALRSPRRRIGAAALAGLAVPALALVLARPVLASMYPWDAFGKAIMTRPGPVWLLGRRAPSLTFYAGRQVFTATDHAALESEVRREPHGWLALTREQWAQLSATGAVKDAGGTLVTARGRMVLVRFDHVPGQQP